MLFVLYAVELGAQPATIGMLAAAFSVFPVLLGVQVGRLSDRIGARRPLIFAAALGGASALIPYFVPGLPAIFVAAVTIGLFDGMFVVSVQSLVGRLSDEETGRAITATTLSCPRAQRSSDRCSQVFRSIMRATKLVFVPCRFDVGAVGHAVYAARRDAGRPTPC